VRRTCLGADPEDLTQALLAHLLVVLPQFDPEDGRATLTTWVFTIANRWLIDQRRRRQLELVPLNEAELVRDPAPSPEAHRAATELRGALEQAIATLPEAQRRSFVMAHVHDQPLEALAQAEGVPLGTIKSRLFRARAALAKLLGPALDRPADAGERHAHRR